MKKTKSPDKATVSRSSETNEATAKVIVKVDSRGGRPHDPLAKVEGMERFCAQWHYRLAIVKMAKKNGLPGFDAHGRVDPVKLIPALNDMISTGTNLPDGIASPQDWLATEKAKCQAVIRQKLEKSVMPTADAKRQNGEAWAFIFSQLEKLALEGPPDFAGRTAVELGIRLNGFKERMRSEAKLKFEEAA